MNMRQVLITLLIGIAAGAAGAVYLPGAALPYLPDALTGRRTTMRGVVVTKEKKPASLLLTVNTQEGALLATFTRSAEETNLLLGPGDSVELRVKDYEPFIENPKILRVVKSGPPVPAETGASMNGPASATAQTGTREVKPAAAGKAAPAATSRKGQR